MSEATQLTQISDNVNQGYIAGRDFYLGDQYIVQETLYFEPDLQDVEPAAWTTTPKALDLADALTAHRLIVLAGQELDDKTMIARHLAWLLRQELPGEVLVREWYRSSDPQKIETAFHQTATTILLLPQVQPHHVGHRLNELSRLLETRSNFAIITTDGTRADWQIQEGAAEERLWKEISWESYYGRSFLAGHLLKALNTDGEHLPKGLPDNLYSGSLLAEGLTVEEAAARLRQPDRIRQFVLWLRSLDTVSSRDILAQLSQLGGERSATFQWYRQLAHADQLLALGLLLFDGLPDDQMFAAVEYLTREAWRRTDPNLPLFDYHALGRLSAYFHLSEAGQDGARIETPSRQKREAILQSAWELQRRRLLAVVPAMTALIKEISPKGEDRAPQEGPPGWRKQLSQVKQTSDTKPASKKRSRPVAAAGGEEPQEDSDRWRFTQGAERELFSSRRRIEQLQRSVIESLSQIGLLSFEAVEASFLELAVDGSASVQTVVAKALAAWRGEGHHARLFRVLQDWWSAGCRVTLPKPLAQRSVEGSDPLSAIRATVALAVGYGVQYDPPNQLSRELLDLLTVVVEDTHPAVRQRVLDVTLPLAAASHAQQLETLLRERLIQDQEQMYAIAFGVAMAYSLRPLEALRIIDRWYLMVHSHGPRDTADLAITPRDRLLTAVALTYGYIRCETEPLAPTQVVAEIHSIFTTEMHPFIRTHALMAMGLQAVHHFELVATMLVELIPEITLSDRHNVVSVFVRAYLNQRADLTGGDGEIESGGRPYQIWTRSERPLTSIESSLYRWLREGGHPVARQVAVRAFAAFSSTDLERQERSLIASRPPVTDLKAIPLARAAGNAPRLQRMSLFGYIAVFLSAPRQKTIRSLVRPVMAEMLAVEQSQDHSGASSEATAASSSVIDRWRHCSDVEVKSLAASLSAALSLFRWRWVIILATVFICVSWYQWQSLDWNYSDSLSEADTLALQQRRAAPMRLAWGHWVPPYRHFKADQLADAEALLRDINSNIKQPVLPARQGELARRPPTGPADRLRRSAELHLARASGELPAIVVVPRPAKRREFTLAEIMAQLELSNRITAKELLWYLRNLPSIWIGRAPIEEVPNPALPAAPAPLPLARETEPAKPGTVQRTSAHDSGQFPMQAVSDVNDKEPEPGGGEMAVSRSKPNLLPTELPQFDHGTPPSPAQAIPEKLNPFSKARGWLREKLKGKKHGQG